MRDPYFYEDVFVLRNKLNIKNAKDLEVAEENITYTKFMDVDIAVKNEAFDFNRLKAIHKHIFGDIYEWAGQTRVINIEKSEEVLDGKSVSYCDYKNIEKAANAAIKALTSLDWKKLNPDERAEQFAIRIARLWQVHPFREGNSRTTMTFACQFAESRGIPMDKEILKIHSDYVRKSLVMSSIGEYSEYKYLIKIIKGSMGAIENQKEHFKPHTTISYKDMRNGIKQIFNKEISDINTVSQEDIKILYQVIKKFPRVKSYEDIKKLNEAIRDKGATMPDANLILKALLITKKLIERTIKKDISGPDRGI